MKLKGLTKLCTRLSIGALLLLMTGAAVLLNREVQRAKAIETTAKQIKQWNGFEAILSMKIAASISLQRLRLNC